MFRLEQKNFTQSELKVQATLIEKGTYMEDNEGGNHTVYYTTFEFADGTRYMFNYLRRKTYYTLREKESGILFYKKGKGEYKFIGFDCTDVKPSEQTLPPHMPYKKAVTIHDGNPRQRIRFIIVLIAVLLLVLYFSLLYFLTLLSFLLLLTLFVNIHLMKEKKLNAIPEQRMEATIVEKKQVGLKLYILFSFKSGELKRIDVPPIVYGVLIKGDTGVLTFKDIEEDTQFIYFE